MGLVENGLKDSTRFESNKIQSSRLTNSQICPIELFHYKSAILAAFLLATIAAAFFANDLNIVYDFERIFAEGDPDLEFYHEYREILEPDDNVIFIALPQSKSIFNRPFLTKLDSFTHGLHQLPHAQSAISITNFFNLNKTPFGLTKTPAIHINQPKRYPSDSLKMMNDERISGILVSKDATTVNIVFKCTHGINQEQTEALVDSLEALVARFDFKDYHTAGKVILQVSFVRKQSEEIRFYTVLSVLLVGFVMLAVFRKPAIVAVALVSVLIATVLFFGILGATQVRLDFMSSLFPILMLIVGMSDVVHILSKFRDELMKGKPKNVAFGITVKEIGLATFLTSLTTAIGFMALVTSRMSPIRDFGILAAGGVFLAYFTVILFTSSLLLLCKPSWLIRQENSWSAGSDLFERLYHKTRLNGRKIGLAYSLVFIVSCVGISQISMSARVKNDVPRNEKIWTDFEFFEEKFGGFRPLEIALFPQGNLLIDDHAVLLEIEKLESFIRSEMPVNGLFSPTMLYKTLHQAHNDGLPRFYQLPQEKSELQKEKKLLKQLPDHKINSIISDDKKLGKIAARMSDVGSDFADSIHAEILGWISANIDSSLLKCRITGTAFLYDSANHYLVKSLFGGLTIAFVLISLLMALLFRNWKMVIISLIPNVLPIIVTAGIMGFSGIVLDAPTAVIFVIAFGIAVDDTIHFLSKFRFERSRGTELEESIRKATTETGKAIFLTSVILIFGFALLMTSAYVPTFRVGLLISITLLVAVVTDLLLLPLLLRVGNNREANN